MTGRTWNKLVMAAVILELGVCMAVVILGISPKVRGIGMVWMVIMLPMHFGFLVPEDYNPDSNQ